MTFPALPRMVCCAFLIVLGGCTQYLDDETIESAITAGIRDQLSLELVSVECPESREVAPGDVFECTARTEGPGRLVFQVTQTEGGNVEWETTSNEGLLDVERVETQVADGIRGQLDIEIVVDCGEPRFRVSNPGATFECSAKSGDDQATVRVEVTSEDGDLNWSM